MNIINMIISKNGYMKSKNATFLFTIMMSSQVALATPQLLPTDEWLFDELNGLVNRNVIELNLSTWPLSLTEVNYALQMAKPENQSDQFVIQRIKRNLKERRDGFTLETELNSQYPLLQTGMGNVYDQSRVSAIQSWGGQYIDFHLQANYLAGGTSYRSRNIDFVGSYAGIRFGNQWLSIGQQKRYWGIAHEGSLVLGDASRPIIGINLQRDLQKPFETKWLSWLGRWQYQLFAGQTLNFEGMKSPENAKLIGMRLSISPADFLDIGFSRIIQWGGKGRIQNWSSLGNALLGKDNAGDNVSIEKEPGNQIAGIDFRIKLNPLIQWPISIYGQIMGEDESKYLPTQNFYLLGIDGSHNISVRQTFNWHLEIADTSTDFGRRYNTTYKHHTYQDGYYHQKLPLGYALGGDMRNVVFGLNSSYHNDDVKAFIQEHHWGLKLLRAETLVGKQSNVEPKIYNGVELSWQGEIPVNQYIQLKLGVSSWYIKAKNDKSQSAVSLKASLEF